MGLYGIGFHVGLAMKVDHNKQTNKQTNGQMDKWTKGQMDKQTNGQTKK
jgi:hypothetical protein